MAKINKEEYPSNSITANASRKEVTQVTKGSVVERQKPLLARIFGENTRAVGHYLLWDVLIPVIKSTILDTISNGTEMLIYGEPDRKRIRRDKSRSYVSYNSIYSDRDRERPSRQRSERNRARSRFDDVIIDSRSEAEEVLSRLVDMIESYDVATVSDFYDLVGLSCDWSDNKYGWENLSRASVARVREGYILDLPKPLPLD